MNDVSNSSAVASHGMAVALWATLHATPGGVEQMSATTIAPGSSRQDTWGLRNHRTPARVEAELNQRLAEMREANARLVVVTIRARQQKEAAEKSSRLKDDVVATVPHEMRMPLDAVLRWARLLGSKLLPSERAEYAVAAIERNATALAHLVDDLLDTTRILNGAIRLAIRPVDLAAVVRAAFDTVRPLAAAKNVRLVLDDASHSRTVSGDDARLQQVIWNLLSNAIEFTPASGRVDVFLESTSSHVEVRVVDHGRGISPGFLPHVFEHLPIAAGTARA